MQTAASANETQARLEASPAEEINDGWRVATGESVTLTVNAPDAREVKFLYRPVVSDEDVYEIAMASKNETGRFTTEFRVPIDLAGYVTAEVAYEDGRKCESETLALLAPEVAANTNGDVQNNNAQDHNAHSGDRVALGLPAHHTTALHRRR
jgi:hypothetical protein